MTLRQLLSTLADNKGTSITLLDIENSELLTFNVEGYTAVESDILDRNVKKVALSKNPSYIVVKITLYAAVNPITPDDGTDGSNG